MTPDELTRAVADGSIDTVIVAFTDHYGRLLGKRFDGGFFVEEGLHHGTHACNYLLTVDMEMEPVAGYSFANWADGYGDFHLVPDLSTLAPAAWTSGAAIVLCDLHNARHQLVDVGPRSVLRGQIERLAEAGLLARTASELEFHIFEESYRDAHDMGYRELTTSGWYNEDYHLLQGARTEPYMGAARRALSASGIPVENSKGEAARGQHELNIRHAEVLQMADRHTVMKHAMKELADQQGISVTFMAKPVQDESGNSCHVHLSLWDSRGEANAFSDDNGAETDLFRHFLGGWMAHINELMVFVAPTVNSYKRYVEQSWAPTRVAWSHDNRTAGFRVVGNGPSLRIECRLPGGDANPYLLYAACLAAGLDGIENQTEPPPVLEGDAYVAEDQPSVPSTLRAAADAFRSSAFARSAFGESVVEHYSHFFESEQRAYDAAVTDWERTRYFERI